MPCALRPAAGRSIVLRNGEETMRKHCFQQLPREYQEILHLDLQNDSKLILLVNGLATVIALAMFAAGFLFTPMFAVFTSPPTLAAFLVCCVLYLVLHELVHGLCMKWFGAKRVRFGFTGLYAFAGSDEYFTKGAYVVVALAPVVVWGAVLLALNVFAGEKLFGLFYLIQLINVSGAAGDLYVCFRFWRLPRDILVRDTGVSMTVYGPEGA